MDIKSAIQTSFPDGFPFSQQDAEQFAVMFCSLDLVNSTLFKSIYREWPVVIAKFYEISVREIHNVSTEFRVWKFVGDEVLFYKVVNSFEELAHDTRDIFRALNSVIDHISAVFPITRNVISVKGTAWLASVVYLPPSEMQNAIEKSLSGGAEQRNIRNMMIPVLTDEFLENKDFLGPDVDIGFRISKFADKRKLVVSANLVKCLMSRSPRESIALEDFKVVGIKVLKGVWGERPYPIIWYHEDWSRINETFYYDEIDCSDTIKAVINNNVRELPFLTKIYSDLNRQGEIDELITIIEGRSVVFPAVGEVVNRSKLAEVHCAAICFRENGLILLGRRPSTKRKFPGKWEFGCGQVHLGQDFHDCISESYREDFSAEFNYISRMPIQTYIIDGDRKVPGLLFYAEIKNPDDVISRFVSKKHTEIKWFDPSVRHDISESDYIPGFRAAIDAAVDYRNKKIDFKEVSE